MSIGVFSLIFLVPELLTELQYYAAEARANMVTDGEEATDAEGAGRDSLELVNHAPSAYRVDKGFLCPRVGNGPDSWSFNILP